MFSARGFPMPSNACDRKDSAFPRSSSSSSSTLGSSNGLYITEPRCSEYFHIHNQYNSPCEIRQCMGRHHPTPYYVCIQCIKEARSWSIKCSRDKQLMVRESVISEPTPLLLCQNCTAAGSQDSKPVGQQCRCMDLTTGWFCFECADVNSWTGKMHMEDLIRREQKVQAQFPQGQQALNVCPGCEDLFVGTETSHHAYMCMTCKDILADEPLDPIATMEVNGAGHTPFPPLQSPNWSGRVRKIREVTQDVAPEETSFTMVRDFETTEWNFPRSSGVKIGPPVPGASAESDAKVRHILRQHFNGSRCLVGEHRREMDHASCRCDELRRKGDLSRFVQELVETEEADNKELGIDVARGVWFRQVRNM